KFADGDQIKRCGGEPAWQAGSPPLCTYPSRKVVAIIASTSTQAQAQDVGAPWLLTAAISPRPRVRVAAVDAHGQVLNEYTGTAPVDGEVPDRPWAVYLAGPDNRVRLVACDLDAKTPPADPDHHAHVLAGRPARARRRRVRPARLPDVGPHTAEQPCCWVRASTRSAAPCRRSLHGAPGRPDDARQAHHDPRTARHVRLDAQR